jgi:hypothetical protein
MRQTPLSGLWLIIIAVVVLIVANRVGRSFGPIGLLLPLIVTIVAFWMLRTINGRATRRIRVDRWRPAQKDVTPREPAIAPREPSAPSLVARPQNPPPVIVVDPSDRTVDGLETRLQALDHLRAQGLLTEQEYEAKRASLIAEF